MPRTHVLTITFACDEPGCQSCTELRLPGTFRLPEVLNLPEGWCEIDGACYCPRTVFAQDPVSGRLRPVKLDPKPETVTHYRPLESAVERALRGDRKPIAFGAEYRTPAL